MARIFSRSASATWVTSWKTLLHLDTDGEWIETMKCLHPPPQARDQGAPPGLVYPEVGQDHALVVNKRRAEAESQARGAERTSTPFKEEVNYVLNQKTCGAYGATGYVDSVKSVLSTRITDQAVPSCPRSPPPPPGPPPPSPQQARRPTPVPHPGGGLAVFSMPKWTPQRQRPRKKAYCPLK